jgi:hypothetical protein
MTESYGEKFARVLTEKPTRAELVGIGEALAREADEWKKQSDEWKAIANSNANLLKEVVAGYGEHVDRLTDKVLGVTANETGMVH